MKIVRINSKFRQLAEWILCHRLVVGVLFAVVVAFSFVGARRIVMRTSFDDYFVSDDPMLIKTNEFKSIFGNDYYVAVLDRKSTRLNSSHANISYAVFCLKKKKIKQYING